MAMTAAQYADQLRQLLPPGRALDDNGHGTLSELLAALADEFARVDARDDALLDEADPRTTFELLPDWERIAGLPDPCAGPLVGLAERRDALVSKLTNRGGQTPAYFIGLAKARGYDVTITEFRPFTVGSAVNDSLNDNAWAYVWQVNSPKTTIRAATVASGVSEPLRAWGNAVLECVISASKPAHTIVLFAYS